MAEVVTRWIGMQKERGSSPFGAPQVDWFSPYKGFSIAKKQGRGRGPTCKDAYWLSKD